MHLRLLIVKTMDLKNNDQNTVYEYLSPPPLIDIARSRHVHNVSSPPPTNKMDLSQYTKVTGMHYRNNISKTVGIYTFAEMCLNN